tara:strand:+ start:195 stop:602 length:408 start_codon:yes stop_codon:yes gene_type:complete
MVEIQCPHCGEDIELEDEASGLFDCPYCNDEFAWDSPLKSSDLKVQFLQFMFAILSPGLIFIASLWTMLAFLDTSGWARLGATLSYYLFSIFICISYTLVLLIVGGVLKSKPISQGASLSLVASYLVIHLTAEVL